MQQYLILSIFISVALAQPCSVWNFSEYECLQHGCAFCTKECDYPPDPFTSHCHYGDFDPQPRPLNNSLKFVSKSNVYQYNGYDTYVLNITEPVTRVVVTINQYQPGSTTTFISQQVVQPDFNNFSWALGSLQSISIESTGIVGLYSMPLYIGVFNNLSFGYDITVTVTNN